MEVINNKQTRKITLFSRITRITSLVIIVQALITFAVIILGGTFNNLNNLALEILEEKTNRQAESINLEIVNRWSNLSDVYYQIVHFIDDDLAKKQKTYQDILDGDQELNISIINDLSTIITNTLSSKAATGVFMAFSRYQENNNKYGLYLRDTNYSLSSPNYGDYVIEIAPLKYQDVFQLLKSTYYQTKFQYSDYDDLQRLVFDQPMQQYLANPQKAGYECGWWSTPILLNNSSIKVLTYSVPLVNHQGEIFGVLGIDISVNYLMSFLPYQELDNRNRGYYLIGSQSINQGFKYDNTIISGINHQEIADFFNEDLVIKNVDKKSDIYFAANLSLQPYYLCYKPLVINNYNNSKQHQSSDYPLNRGSDLENDDDQLEKWYIVAIVHKDVISSPSNRLRASLYIALLVSFIICLIVTAILIRYLVSPIIKSSNAIKNSLALTKTGIYEFDELINSIVNLNNQVQDSSLRLSRIVGLLEMPIVAFECDLDNNVFFASKDLMSVLRIDNQKEIDAVEFNQLIQSLQPYLIREEDNISTYKYLDLDNQFRWIDIRFVANSNQNNFSGIIIDLTKDYLEKEKILYERDYDILTDIYNRRAFLSKYYQLFVSNIDLKNGAFLMIDLDNLKFINDNYGHDFGDQYIQKLAKIITKLYHDQENCLYGRRSGDEFYMFYYGFDNHSQILEKINSLLSLVNNEILTAPNNEKIRIRISSGISLYPNDSTEPDELIKFADYAMYEVKNNFKGSYRLFDLNSYNRNSYIVKKREELNVLIEEELVDFYFQAIASATTGEILGYESLMRPLAETFKNPNEILQVAKAHSKLHLIERLTFLKTLAKWERCLEYFGNRYLFLNSIPGQILSELDIDFVVNTYGRLLKNLVVEFIESERDTELTRFQKLDVLERCNAKIAIDDFGAGYNSDAILLAIPANFIKIDMALIRNIDTDRDRQRIVKNIITYAQSKKILTIAEGVETIKEMEFLIKIGCDYLQGYLIDLPSPLPKPLNQEIVDQIRMIAKKYRQ